MQIDLDKLYSREEAIQITGYSPTFFKHYVSPKVQGTSTGRIKSYFGHSLVNFIKSSRPRKIKSVETSFTEAEV